MEVTGREALDIILSKKRAQDAAGSGDDGVVMCGDEDDACELPLPPADRQKGAGR